MADRAGVTVLRVMFMAKSMGNVGLSVGVMGQCGVKTRRGGRVG